MSARKYHFVTRWRFEGTPEDVFALISRPEEFPRWWGSVYLGAQEMDRGDESGLGRSVRFRTKGFLPYRLNWQSRAVEIDKPRRLVVEATGDLAGRGTWYLEQDQYFTDVMFEWQVSADKQLLRFLSWLLKPLFKANHVWAMEEGRRGLEKELQAMHSESSQGSPQASPQTSSQAPRREGTGENLMQKRAKHARHANPPAA